jgi:hypothetical protein
VSWAELPASLWAHGKHYCISETHRVCAGGRRWSEKMRRTVVLLGLQLLTSAAALALRPSLLHNRQQLSRAPFRSTVSMSLIETATTVTAIADPAAPWFSAGLFVSPFDETGALTVRGVGRDLILLYAYGHVPIVPYLLWFYQKNGNLKNAWPPKLG